MWRIVFVYFLLTVGIVLGTETKKPESKYPKKYSKDTLPNDKVKFSDSSYTSFNDGPIDPLVLPPIYYKYYSVLQQPQDDFRTFEVPSDYMVPPAEDTYSVYEDRPVYSLVVPKSELRLVKKYLGYAVAANEEELTDPLTVPEKSSYSEVQKNEEPFFTEEMSPPMEDRNTDPESSYLNVNSSTSSYSSYNIDASDLISMRPPPPPSN